MPSNASNPNSCCVLRCCGDSIGVHQEIRRAPLRSRRVLHIVNQVPGNLRPSVLTGPRRGTSHVVLRIPRQRALCAGIEWWIAHTQEVRNQTCDLRGS